MAPFQYHPKGMSTTSVYVLCVFRWRRQDRKRKEGEGEEEEEDIIIISTTFVHHRFIV